jgi:hypothetical protein
LQTQVFDLEAKMDLLKIFVKSKFTEQIKVTFEKELQKENPAVIKKKEEVKEELKEDKKTLSEIFHDLKNQDEKSVKVNIYKKQDLNDDYEDDKLEKDNNKDDKLEEDLEEVNKEEKKEKVLKKRGKKIRI